MAQDRAHSRRRNDGAGSRRSRSLYRGFKKRHGSHIKERHIQLHPEASGDTTKVSVSDGVGERRSGTARGLQAVVGKFAPGIAEERQAIAEARVVIRVKDSTRNYRRNSRSKRRFSHPTRDAKRLLRIRPRRDKKVMVNSSVDATSSVRTSGEEMVGFLHLVYRGTWPRF